MPKIFFVLHIAIETLVVLTFHVAFSSGEILSQARRHFLQSCLCGAFCIECLACQVAGDMNECCLCGTSVAMRTHYRTKYGIPGSICDDCLVTHCCLPCSLCQMKRDIKRRIAMRTF